MTEKLISFLGPVGFATVVYCALLKLYGFETAVGISLIVIMANAGRRG